MEKATDEEVIEAVIYSFPLPCRKCKHTPSADKDEYGWSVACDHCIETRPLEELLDLRIGCGMSIQAAIGDWNKKNS